MATNNKLIIKNSLMLYFRLGVGTLVGLYTSRVLLHALGVENYGIYNVIGGLVALFAIVTNTLTAAISRFVTYELGSGNNERLRMVFSTAFCILCVMAIIVLALCEGFGLWLLDTQLVIAPERMEAAHWVFHISVATFVLKLVSVPYGALMIAHERMSVYAYVGLAENFLNLGVAMILSCATGDRLVLYAVLLFGIQVLVQVFYWTYCRRHFLESVVSIGVVRCSMFREIFAFAGWNFIGASSGLLRDHGGNVLLNIFFGPTVNAARGVAMQISSKVGHFITSFTTAAYPQITKSYAVRDFKSMMPLVFRTSRFSYYLFFLLSLPIVLNIDVILRLWLHEVPEHTQIFTILIITNSLLETISNPLVVSQLATGNIRDYQIVVGGLMSLNFPISYLCLRYGCPPESVFVVAVLCTMLCTVARMVMLRRMMPFSARAFFYDVIVRLSVVSLVGSILPVAMRLLIDDGVVNLVVTSVVSLVSIAATSIWLGCTSHERDFIIGHVRDMCRRYIGK